MKDTTEVTLTCPKCDTAFTARYSPYAPAKTVDCTSCGAAIPLPGPNANRAQPQPTVSAPPHSPSPWYLDNRYTLCGSICLAISAISMILSLSVFQIYLPLAGLSVVFGVLAVVDRKPMQGLLLILSTTVLGAMLHAYLFDQQYGEELRRLEQSMSELNKLLNK